MDQNNSKKSEDAVFLGWQNDLHNQPFALYNITAEGHSSYGSTVTERMLREMNLQVPSTKPR